MRRLTKAQELRDYSLIAYCFERLFRLLQILSPSGLLRIPNHIRAHMYRARMTEEELAKSMKRQTRLTDVYLLICFTTEAALVLVVSFLGGQVSGWKAALICGLAALRILDIFQVNINMVVFDRMRLSSHYPRALNVVSTGWRKQYVASYTRTFVLTVLNYFELLVCFGLMYSVGLGYLVKAGSWTDAFYFSAISQLTIGYGDLSPEGPLKLVAVIQGIAGFFFGLLVLARIFTILPKPGSVLGDEE